MHCAAVSAVISTATVSSLLSLTVTSCLHCPSVSSLSPRSHDFLSLYLAISAFSASSQEATTRHRYLQQEMLQARERLVQVQHSLGVDDTALPPLPLLPHSLTPVRKRPRHVGSGGGGLEEEEKGSEEGEDRWRREEEGIDEEPEEEGMLDGREGQEGLDAVREREERTVERQEKEERRDEEAREEEEKRRMGFFMPRVLSADFGFGPPM
ncbi:unnamed protein product [Closterium sp. NIES-54]